MFKTNFIFLSLFCLSMISYSQIIPITTEDYSLKAYPSKVRYQKFETDTLYRQIDKRKSFIDDYEITFNENRKLTSKVNYIDGQKDRYSVVSYNVNKSIDKEELFEPNGKIVSTVSYNYAYLGRLSEVITVEYPASLGGANKMVKKETYRWNKNGQLAEYSIYGDDQSIHKTTKYFYGPQDSLIYTITKYGYNKNVEKTTYKRDFAFYVSEVVMYRNDSQVRREVYQRDENYNIINKKVYNGKNKLTLEYKMTYDQHGFITSEIGIDNKGAWALEYYYKYEKDKFFNWTKKTTYDGWEPKYIEIREITYSNKDHFYDDLKDEDAKKVVRERLE